MKVPFSLSRVALRGASLLAALASLASGQNQTWIRQFGSPLSEFPFGAASDGVGGVYLTGTTNGILGGPSAGNTDIWLARYDGAGNQIWIRQFGSSGVEYASAVAADGSSGVYLVGSTSGSLGGPNAGHQDAWLARYDGGLTATTYCTPAISDSAGQPAVLQATGSNAIAANDLALHANQLPQDAFGFFLTSRVQGNTFPVSNSQGRLCLGGSIGRYVGAGQVLNSGDLGEFSLAVNLNAMPTPTGPVAVQPGDTWNFQAWFRDANPGVTSNFTDAASVTFL